MAFVAAVARLVLLRDSFRGFSVDEEWERRRGGKKHMILSAARGSVVTKNA